MRRALYDGIPQSCRTGDTGERETKASTFFDIFAHVESHVNSIVVRLPHRKAVPTFREPVPAQPVDAPPLWSFDLTIRFKGTNPLECSSLLPKQDAFSLDLFLGTFLAPAIAGLVTSSRWCIDPLRSPGLPEYGPEPRLLQVMSQIIPH